MTGCSLLELVTVPLLMLPECWDCGHTFPCSHACLFHEMKTAQFLTHSPRYYFMSLPWECILTSIRVHTSVI